MGQGPHDLGLENVDLIHVPSIDTCAHAHQCGPARSSGPFGPED
jgi:hypothetical protein